MPQLCTVLIVGAGPVGLALALALTRAGVAVRIIDKAAQRSTTSKALGLQYRVSEILAILGVADRFLAVGGSPTVVNFYADRRKLAALRFIAPPGLSGNRAFRPQAIMIAQSETERLLGEALTDAGIDIEWNTEFVALSQGNGCVRAQLRRPNGDKEIEVAWLVGCDGAHSAVRKQAGLGFAGKVPPDGILHGRSPDRVGARPRREPRLVSSRWDICRVTLFLAAAVATVCRGHQSGGTLGRSAPIPSRH